MPARIHLNGPFRVEAPDGKVVTPVAAKAQGLLLLLLLSPRGERTRRWLQDKLWSDRAPEQGAGSLRQSLRQIRLCFGDHGPVLRADRQRVAIDLASLEIVTEGGAELAEGLDVRDPEFEEWLAVERSARATDPAPPSVRQSFFVGRSQLSGLHPGRIHIRAVNCTDLAVHWLGQLVADALARDIRERLSHDVLRSEAEPESGELAITVDGYRETGARIGLRISLSVGPTERHAWSGFRTVEQKGAPAVEHPLVQQLIVDASAAIDTAIQERCGPVEQQAREQDPDLLCRSAVRAIFSMAPEQLLLADEMLRLAKEIRPHAVYDAWRAQIRVIQRVERHRGDIRQFEAEGERFGRIAEEADPGNSMVVAILANVHHFLLADSPGSLELANRSVRLNPGNPMALWSRSTARLYTGETKLAHKDAMHGRFLMQSSELRFFWDLQLFASSLVMGKIEDALQMALHASAQRKLFRPPHRYLTALHAHFSDENRAIEEADKLRRLEPDFSIDRLLHDHAYPASLIRRSPALRTDRLMALL